MPGKVSLALPTEVCVAKKSRRRQFLLTFGRHQVNLSALPLILSRRTPLQLPTVLTRENAD